MRELFEAPTASPGRVLTFLIGFMVAFAAAGVSGAPLEAYGHLPSVQHVTLSPDGAHLAFVTTSADTAKLIVRDLVKKSALSIKVDSLKLRRLSWADSDHLLITQSYTGRAADVISNRGEWFLGQVLDLKTEQTHPLVADGSQRIAGMNVIAGKLQPRTLGGRPMVFLTGIQFVGGQSVLSLFSEDLATGAMRVVQTGTSPSREWVVDAEGKVVARTSYEEKTHHWSLEVRKEDGWDEAYGLDSPIDLPTVEGINFDGKTILVNAPNGESYDRWLVNLADGSRSDPLEGLYGANDFIEDPATHRLIGSVRVSAEKFDYAFFNLADQNRWSGIAEAFADSVVRLVSLSSDHRYFVVRVDGPKYGSIYVLVDTRTGEATPFANAYAEITAANVAPVEAIAYQAKDGLKIPAYLTLPLQREKKNLPLIVLVHGGPASRDAPGFDWWAQGLASRGYAVLQPQYRGSNWFGSNFQRAGYGEWGRKMQSDLSDGVKDLVKRGVVDAARVCIVGGSYGGYAALAGATFDREAYRCAVSVAGPSDLSEMLDWSRKHAGKHAVRYWDRFMGVTGADDPKLSEISPALHVAGVTAPILIIHGKDDTVVPIAQSEIMERALKKAGKPVKFVRLSGEDHWLSKPQTRLEMLRETVGFLEANNPPR